MFATKPTSAKAELEELSATFSHRDLAVLLSRRPETISKIVRRERFQRSLEQKIDDLWTVVHVGRQHGLQPEETRFFLLSRSEKFDYRAPLEALQEGKTEVVIDAIGSNGHGSNGGSSLPAIPARGSRRDELIAKKPGTSRAEARERFKERARTFAGIDVDALTEVHESGWTKT